MQISMDRLLFVWFFVFGRLSVATLLSAGWYLVPLKKFNFHLLRGDIFFPDTSGSVMSSELEGGCCGIQKEGGCRNSLSKCLQSLT